MSPRSVGVGGASPRVRVTGISITYSGRPLLERVSFSLHEHEMGLLMGPSGSGKTSLLRCLMGLQKPAAGTVIVDSVDMTKTNAKDAARMRRTRMGLAFQSPELLPELNVVDNVALLMIFDGTSRDEARDAARRALGLVDLADKAERSVDTLSGGEAQRVALARAIARPSVRILLADEPTASLDRGSAVELIGVIRELTTRLGLATLVASHDERFTDVDHQLVDLGARG